MMNKYARVFSIIKQLTSIGVEVTHTSLVEDFTEGKKNSLTNLSLTEFQEFERRLILLAPKQQTIYDHDGDPRDKCRKAIISIFKSIGRTTEDAIAWAEKYGVNKQKKGFNEYTGQELWLLIHNAEKVKSDFLKGVSKKL